jgi:hypothetical protein
MFPEIKSEKLEKSKSKFAERKLILRHLIRRETVLRSVHDTVKSLKLFEDEPMLDLVWQVTSYFFDLYGGVVTKEVILLELLRIFEESPPEDDGYTEPEMRLLLDELFIEQEFMDKHVLELISKYKKQFHLAAINRDADDDKSVNKHLEGLQDAAKLKVQKYVPEEVRIFKGLTSVQDILPYLMQTDRIPTGVDFIDHALDGGVLKGEVIGLIMPTKAGKTTLSLQIASEKVVRSEHVMYVQFEQVIQGDLALRKTVLCSASTRKDWKLKPGELPSSEVQDRLVKAAPYWDTYLHAFDGWVSSANPLYSPSEIFELVGKLTKENKKPGLVILDWWGQILNKMLVCNGIHTEDTKRAQQAYMHEIKTCAKDYDVPVIIFHQLRGASAGKKGIATAHDAQGDRDWPNLMDACFVSSRKDSESHVTFRLDISRSTACTDDIRVKLDGQRCKFVADAADFGVQLIDANTDSAPTVDNPWEVN